MTFDPSKALIAVAAATCLGATALRADEPALSQEQMASAITLDQMTVPAPGELFAALNKEAKPNWSLEFRGPLNVAYSDRGQIALNLGGLIADGYIAVEAMDGQQVKNLGRDILGLAKNLGISSQIAARGNTIIQFADDNDWNSLKEELESTQNEAKQALDALHDEDLVTLLSIGGWIRGTEVVSDLVYKNYTQQLASVLRQPELVTFLRGKIDALSPKVKDAALIKSVSEGLAGIEKIVSFPLGETMSKDDVKKLHDQAAALVKLIATK